MQSENLNGLETVDQLSDGAFLMRRPAGDGYIYFTSDGKYVWDSSDINEEAIMSALSHFNRELIDLEIKEEAPFQENECQHDDFEVHSAMSRYVRAGHKEDSQLHYILDVAVSCKACGVKFVFNGLNSGTDISSPTVSTDNQSARLPIFPSEIYRHNLLELTKH